MATHVKTVRYAATTRLTALATATTLAGATRHDFAAIPTYLPETTRQILSAWIQVSARDANTTAYDFDGARIGIRTGDFGANPVASATWDDLDITLNTADSGDHERLFVSRDITAYIEPRDQIVLGNPTTFELQIGVAFATETASNVNGITAEVFITYEYDDAASTHIKTIQIPIQSHHATLTTSAVEVGTTGGTSNAPANQIPQLTGAGGFLPESGVTIRQSYLVVMANEGAPSGTTDFTPTLGIDAATSARATIEQALTTGATYFDIAHLSELGSPATTAAHAFKAYADLTARLENLGAILVVTYEFTASSATQLVSIEVPVRAGGELPSAAAGAAWTDAHDLVVEVEVQEPATITIKQSGILVHWARAGNGPVPYLASAGQTERGYGYISLARDGASMIVHRCDHSSSTWALARGKNSLALKALELSASSQNGNHPFTATAIINYHCGKATDGCGVHARTIKWAYGHASTEANTRKEFTSAVSIEATRRIFGANAAVFNREQLDVELMMQTLSGDDIYPRWRVARGQRSTGYSDLGQRLVNFDVTDWIADVDIEASRKWTVGAPAAVSAGLTLALTYHCISYTFAGNFTVDGAAPTDGTLDLFEGASGKRLGQITNAVASAYSFTVYDDTILYYVAAYDEGVAGGRSVADAPTTGRDIVVYTSGGGGLNVNPIGSPIIKALP